MYFPKKFDRIRALELLELVNQAYLQYDACKDGKSWSLPSEYSLIKELYYTGTGTGQVAIKSPFFDRELQGMLRYLNNKKQGLPIGFIVRRKNDLYVIFRGTMTATEWIRNLNVNLKPYPYRDFGNVHEGFLQVYNVVQKDIWQSVAHIENIKRVFIAGHSLGGALATLLTPDLVSDKRFKSITVYTYGSPRVGDSDFAQAYNQRFANQTFRIANTSDFVVSVPLPASFMGFIGGYFSHIDTPVDFTVQKNDIEKNHQVETYLTALKDSHQPWIFFRRLFG